MAIHLEELRLRQQMYEFLATLFASVPALELVESLQAEPLQSELRRLLGGVAGEAGPVGVAGAAGPELDRLASQPAVTAQEALSVEYSMLFSVPGASQVVPHESVYRDKLVVDMPPQPEIDYPGGRRVFEGLYWGDSTVAVAAEYGAEGFDVEGEIPDSLALELGFMGYLCGQEMAHAEAGNQAAAEASAYRQAKFLREHLLEWVPAFVARMQQKRGDGFYTLAAMLVLRYLESEAAQIRVA